jgi:hypothetical protein
MIDLEDHQEVCIINQQFREEINEDVGGGFQTSPPATQLKRNFEGSKR